MKNETGLAVQSLSIAERLHASANEVIDPREVCYFFGNREYLIKIGYTRNLSRRINGLKGNSGPVKTQLLAVASGGPDREAAYHRQFAEHRFSGEWFDPHPDILAEIDRLNAAKAPTA